MDEVRSSAPYYVLPVWVNDLTLLPGAASAYGNELENRLTGNASANYMIGYDGNDTLNGAGGMDTLWGGNGNDSFLFTVAPSGGNAALGQDFVSGADEIRLDARVMPTLGQSGDFVSTDARFYSGAGVNAGHDADDRVIYNTSTGQLWYDADGSGASQAQLIATFVNPNTGQPYTLLASDIAVDNGSSPVPGTMVNGTAGDDSLTGGAGPDTLNGFDGDDTLDGGVGADSMVGGPGDDVYYVDNANDTIVEAQNGGIDEVRSTTYSYLLPSWVNNLTLTGGAYGGFGNDIDNVLTGSALDNHLDAREGNDVINAGDGNDLVFGGSGNDTMAGGAGSDEFWQKWDFTGATDAGSDVIDGGADFDTLRFDAPVVSALSGVVVNFAAGTASGGGAGGAGRGRFTSIGGVVGTEFGDVFFGSGAGEILNGMGGNDTLHGSGTDLFIGGAGADQFYFEDAPQGIGGVQRPGVNDFASGTDKLHLDARFMSALGASGQLAASDPRFYAAAGATSGHDADDRVIYDTSQGRLWYDADGNGVGEAQLIGTLSMQSGSIWVPANL